jgi:hypothetical protein
MLAVRVVRSVIDDPNVCRTLTIGQVAAASQTVREHMSDDITSLIEKAVRKVEALRRTEARLAEAMRKQTAERPSTPARRPGP